ncbi:MAG: hypothetical protein AAFQ57_09795, partial [Cyanobacteria bacterium J06626_14]
VIVEKVRSLVYSVDDNPKILVFSDFLSNGGRFLHCLLENWAIAPSAYPFHSFMIVASHNAIAPCYTS